MSTQPQRLLFILCGDSSNAEGIVQPREPGVRCAAWVSVLPAVARLWGMNGWKERRLLAGHKIGMQSCPALPLGPFQLQPDFLAYNSTHDLGAALDRIRRAASADRVAG